MVDTRSFPKPPGRPGVRPADGVRAALLSLCRPAPGAGGGFLTGRYVHADELDEAVAALQIADELRQQPEGYWVEPHWLAIASDGAGQHLMVDDKDGRVLAVAHDDDHVDVVAPSIEAWLEHLIDGHAAGTVVWDEVFGLVDASRLAAIHAARRAHEARRQPAAMTSRQKVGLGFTLGGLAALIALVIWWLESR